MDLKGGNEAQDAVQADDSCGNASNREGGQVVECISQGKEELDQTRAQVLYVCFRCNHVHPADHSILHTHPSDSLSTITLQTHPSFRPAPWTLPSYPSKLQAYPPVKPIHPSDAPFMDKLDGFLQISMISVPATPKTK